MPDDSAVRASQPMQLPPIHVTDYELPEGQPSLAVGIEKHIAQETSEWMAVCTYPDYCAVGNSVVPFDSAALLNQHVLASPDVKARGSCVYRQGDMFKCILGDAGAHLVSETSLLTGHVLLLEGHSKVKANNIPVACHDGACMINTDDQGKGGTPGKLITESGMPQPAPSTTPALPGKATSDTLTWLDQLEADLGISLVDYNKLDEYVRFGDVYDTVDLIDGTAGSWTDQVAQATRGVLKFAFGFGEGAYELTKLAGTVSERMTLKGMLQTAIDSARLAENIRLGNVTPGGVGDAAAQIGQAIIVPPEAQEAYQKGNTTEGTVHTVLNVGTLVAGLAKSVGGLFRVKVKPVPVEAPPQAPPVPPKAPVPPEAPPPPKDVVQNGVKVKRNSAEGGKFGEDTANAKMKELGYERIDTGGEYVHGHGGIDAVYKNLNPPPDYVVIDAKYNTAELEKLTNGTRQMSDDWISERLNKAVGKPQADIIRAGLEDGSVARVVIKVSEEGKTVGRLVNKDGYIIRGNKGNWPL